MHIINTVFTDKISPISTNTIPPPLIIPSHSDTIHSAQSHQSPLPSSQPSSSPSASPTITSPSYCSGNTSDHHQPIDQSKLGSQAFELDHQLEQLSSKLVKSIERIASLEDELHESRRKNEKLASREQHLSSSETSTNFITAYYSAQLSPTALLTNYSTTQANKSMDQFLQPMCVYLVGNGELFSKLIVVNWSNLKDVDGKIDDGKQLIEKK